LRGGFLERDSIHAISQSAGRGTIREDMSEMSVAGIAYGFDAFQKRRPVKAVCDCVNDHRLGKRRPPGAGFEFLRRIEENGFAAEAGIDPRLK